MPSFLILGRKDREANDSDSSIDMQKNLAFDVLKLDNEPDSISELRKHHYHVCHPNTLCR